MCRKGIYLFQCLHFQSKKALNSVASCYFISSSHSPCSSSWHTTPANNNSSLIYPIYEKHFSITHIYIFVSWNLMYPDVQYFNLSEVWLFDCIIVNMLVADVWNNVNISIHCALLKRYHAWPIIKHICRGSKCYHMKYVKS